VPSPVNAETTFLVHPACSSLSWSLQPHDPYNGM
jgi:hypothetical protein